MTDDSPASGSRPKLLDRVRQALRLRHYVGGPSRRMSHGFDASSCTTGNVIRASWVYGAGLRLLECAELRVKDLNFDRGELLVRDGKGGKDRVTMLPAALTQPLVDHLTRVRAQHDADLAAGRASVALPGALRAKYPGAPREWPWQWVFPATRFYVDDAKGERRRHHLHESVLQRAVKDAAPPGTGMRMSDNLLNGITSQRTACHQ